MSDIHVTVSERHGRHCVGSGSRWEPIFGYSRAVRTGNVIAVSGTVGANADGTYAPSMAAQARRALEIIGAAIEALGGRLEHVVRTRMFVTDISKSQELSAVHGAVFGDIRPAATLVEISRLIHPDAQIEIEADAILPPGV